MPPGCIARCKSSTAFCTNVSHFAHVVRALFLLRGTVQHSAAQKMLLIYQHSLLKNNLVESKPEPLQQVSFDNE
jgi:hypothetical protein